MSPEPEKWGEGGAGAEGADRGEGAFLTDRHVLPLAQGAGLLRSVTKLRPGVPGTMTVFPCFLYSFDYLALGISRF